MSALPNPLPRISKPAGRAKYDQYGRDPKAYNERVRREPGYTQYPHSFHADVGRLTSGNVCTQLIYFLWDRSAGRPHAKGKPAHEWTGPLIPGELAQLFCCDERSVERELKGLQDRGIAEVKRPAPGKVECRLRVSEWISLPTLKSKVVEMPVAEDPAEDLKDEEEAKPGNQRVTGKKPMRLAAGATSKALPVSVGVKSYRAKVEGPVDCEISAVVKAGEFLTIIRFPDDLFQKLSKQFTQHLKDKELTGSKRHGCRADEANVGRKANTGRIDHQRAAELCKLFDPLLAKSAAKLLGMDSVSLQSACEAVGDCDHDYLVKFAVQRASSPITKPSHVKIICREALASWRAAQGSMPGSDDAPSMEEIKAMAAKEREIRLARSKR